MKLHVKLTIRSQWTVLLALSLTCICQIACSEARRYPATDLKGRVTIGGKALQEGALQFFPKDRNQGPAVGAEIKAGGFEARAVPLGKLHVDFTAIRKTHQLPDDGSGLPKWATENLIPAEHRQGMDVEIKAGQTELNLDL